MMKKFLKKKLGNEKGMTLIELLAVIVILAIIAAIAIPAIGNIIENSRHGAVKSDYQNAISAANLYFTENAGETDVTVTELLADFLDDAGSLDPAVVITKPATGSLNISGEADRDKDGTNDYEIPAADAQTNADLSGFTSAEFGTEFGL